MPTSVEKEILKTIGYFDFFDYQPSLDEIHTYISVKISKKRLLKRLDDLIKKRVVFELRNTLEEYGKNNKKYTQGRYGIKEISNFKFKIKNSLLRRAESKRKLEKIKLFVKVLSKFKQIKLIGLSGSMAMMNAAKIDDIDLFIITGRNRLFTGRVISLLVAQVMGIRRRRIVGGWLPVKNSKDKICLNLFFDEANLSVPKFKRSEYVAHEVLQMRPLINKDQAYERFLLANQWVYDIFPNAKNNLKFKIKNLKLNKNSKFKIKNFLGNCLETVVKIPQLWSINKHKTTEIITDTQLWFFPDDFEKKVLT